MAIGEDLYPNSKMMYEAEFELDDAKEVLFAFGADRAAVKRFDRR